MRSSVYQGRDFIYDIVKSYANPEYRCLRAVGPFSMSMSWKIYRDC